MKKRRAMTAEKARFVRAEVHKDALEFALAIGLKSDYKNDLKVKKDVIDQAGDAYSVKSGQKRWQIFLYGKNRFETDNAFKSMNGIGQLLIECINLYPDSFTDYQKNKIDVFADNLDVRNSKARNKTQTSDQKVIFKYKDKNLGELEMRNSGFNHYKEVLFVMNKKQVLDLLLNNIKVRGKYKGKILLYGDADKKFIHRKNIF